MGGNGKLEEQKMLQKEQHSLANFSSTLRGLLKLWMDRVRMDMTCKQLGLIGRYSNTTTNKS